jgi:GMP synthase-like glutamine amidotransferase
MTCRGSRRCWSSSAHCANQGFAIGKHFGMQCHVEMTEELIRVWARGGADEIRAAAASPAVQKAEEMERDLEPRLLRLHEVADRIYDRWSENLSRGN